MIKPAFSFLLLFFITVSLYGQTNISSSGPVVLPASGQTSYPISSGSIMSGSSITLNPGVTITGGPVYITSSTLLVPSPPSNPAADLNMNWVQTLSYDEGGKEIGSSKAFFDNNGKALQTQTKNEATGHVLASQTIYDLQGRAVLSTLAAPTYNSAFAYKGNFVTNNNVAYSYLNFDGDPTSSSNQYAKVNLPDPVDNTQIGSLGWYYSNKNTIEPMVASTGFPYSRSEFYHDGTGAANRDAGIGETLKMGAGHETTSNSFPVQNELTDYLTLRNRYFPLATVGSSPASMSGQALQSVSTDQNGTSVLSVTDLSGKMSLMTARADASSGAWLSVPNTVNLTNVGPGYSFTALKDPNGLQINSLTISSSDVVTITCGTCGIPPYTGIGNNYVYTATGPAAGNLTFQITSLTPFTVTESVINQLLTNPIVPVYDQAEAQYQEPTGTAIQYFQLATSSVVNITGGSGNFILYNMSTSTDMTTSYLNAPSAPLSAGYYKVIAIAPSSTTATNNITVSYTNKYSDISYNYYNQLGQLIGSIAPNGVQQLTNLIKNAGTLPASPPFTTTYQYDLQGRLVSTNSPDGGTSQFIYRLDGKIRFSQNAYQLNPANFGSGLERFSYTNYDSFGRAIESGEYQTSAGTFATLAANTAILKATDPTGGLTGGTKISQINTVYDVPGTTGVTGYTQDPGFLKGAVSYTYSKVNGISSSTTYYNYDDHGRVSWLVKVVNGLSPKTVDYTYDDMGNVLTVDYQKSTSAERFTHYYLYDADGGLINLKTSVGGSATQTQQANYYYYLHGPLKRVELGSQLQGMDYVYTPQGWLKAINSPTGSATNDPMQDGLTNGFAKDAFGMQLEYFLNDYTRQGSNVTDVATNNQNYYNGNVAGMSWQSNTPQPGAPNPPYMYTYSYDEKYQYKGATWGTPNYATSPGTFVPSSSGIFQEKGITYDPNGNITGLQRTDKNGGTPTDIFTYNYPATNNQLTSVTNGGASTNAQPYGTYTYDEIGRLKTQVVVGKDKDGNLTTTNTYLQYDVSGKITGIFSAPAMTPASLVESYTYDESGNRITVTNANGTTYYVYDASGNTLAIYKGTTPALSEVPIYGSSRLGTYFVTGAYCVYEIRDNVGSVRVVFTDTKTTDKQANIYNYTDYYPYGLVAQQTVTGSYRYFYQGAYAETDPATGYDNFKLRMYDARIGRWMSVDPEGQFSSPYEGMGNDPVTGFDKDGGFEEKPDGTPLYDPGDWHVSDRLGNTDLWKSANLYNLQHENSDQYQTFDQRIGFYKWADNLAHIEGQKVHWIDAAIAVASDASQVQDYTSRKFLSEEAQKMAYDLNAAIIDGAMSPLKELLIDHASTPLTGDAAKSWDARTLWTEQGVVAESIFKKYSASVILEWQKVADHNKLSWLGLGSSMFGHLPVFQGDLGNRLDRVKYGWSLMYPK